MSLIHIVILAIVQGLAELLPVSSSAHVIVAERLLGLDPAAPEMTLLLVLLHTGTMLAVIIYFWSRWRERLLASWPVIRKQVPFLIGATAATGIIGVPLILGIEHIAVAWGLVAMPVAGSHQQVEVEQLFGNLTLIAVALVVVGLLIVIAGIRSRKQEGAAELSWRSAIGIGAVQGLCLPFRGFSRSGATISTGLLAGVDRARAEEFSFALAVIITPPAIARELWRVVRDHHQPGSGELWSHVLVPGLVGMVCAFVVGLFALRWLSQWLETGHWHWFGYYCLAAAAGVLVVKNLF
jgi:undecaprenyl-diphosphatase